MNLNFAPLSWPTGAEYPGVPRRVHNKLAGTPKPRPSLIIFDAWGPRSKTNSAGARFVVPSCHIRGIGQQTAGYKPLPIALCHVLEAYRVEGIDHTFKKIQSFFSDTSEAAKEFKDTRIDHKEFIYHIGDVYQGLLGAGA